MKYLFFLAIAYIVYKEVRPTPVADPAGAAQTVDYAPQQRSFTQILPVEKVDDLLDLVKSFEGFSPTVYQCQGGVDTIGYGITDPDVVSRGELTEEEASEILKEEISLHLSYVDTLVKKPLTQSQRNALASFSFNCGDGSLRKIAARINRGDIEEAGEALLLYIYADGKPSEGLKKRRMAEYELFNS